VSRWIQDGKLPGLQIVKSYYVSEWQLKRFIRQGPWRPLVPR
jgi:hypothetical protein